jgi:hypothetical protein
MGRPVGRNDNCPCGSGKKYKRCCIGREREHRRRAKAIEELVGLPTLFPLLQPQDEAFERWLAEQPTLDPSRELIEEGINVLPAAERERIVRAHGKEFPQVWKRLVANLGGEANAAGVVLIAAVAAAFAATHGIDPRALEVIEYLEQFRSDPAGTLAHALEPGDLWSVAEAAQAKEAIARIPDWADDHAYELRWDATFEREAARHWSDAHERRLGLLVDRIRAQLPADGHARASASLAEAIALFERHPAFRRELATMLLAGTLGGPASLGRDYSVRAA